MIVKCIDAGNSKGTGTGLLTEGQLYLVLGREGGYYRIKCDNGKVYTKSHERFEVVRGGV